MNSFLKAMVGICLVAAVAIVGIYSQYWTTPSSSQSVTLTADELTLFAQNMLGAREQSQFAKDPEARKKFLERISKQLSLAAEAQRRHLDADENTKVMMELGAAQVLQGAYSLKHPELAKPPRGVQATDQEKQAWIAAHPEDLARFTKFFESQGHGMPAPKPDDIAGIFVIADKARAEGLERDALTSLQLKLSEYSALIQALNEKLEKESEMTDDQIRAYYAEHSASGEMDELHVEHILFSTMAQPPSPMDPTGGGAKPDEAAKRALAEQVLQRVKNGEDFAELAKQFSDDPGSKENGGDLGFAKRFQFVPEFEDAAWKLKAGEVSGIVETDFGLHIIKVVERKPPAAEITPDTLSQLKEQLKQRKFEEMAEEIAKRNPINLPADFTVPEPEMPDMSDMPMMMPPHGGGEQMPPPPPPGEGKGEKPAAKPAAKPAGGKK